MKNFLLNLNLAYKLSILILVLSAFGTFVILTGVYVSSVYLNDILLNRELNTSKEIIEKAYIEPLWNFDQNQIEKVTNIFLNDNGFVSTVAIKLIDSHGKVLISKNNHLYEKRAFENYSSMDFSKTVKSILKKDGEILGEISIVFSSQWVMNEYRKMLIYIFLFSFFIIIFTNFGLYFLFYKMLTVPLNKVLEHVKLIKEQVYDSKFYKTSSHEMDLICDALNYTSQIIKRRDNELKNYVDNLEKIVEERTKELEIQIVNNISASRLAAAGEAACGIAHEINNPLMIIAGHVTKIKRQMEGRGPEFELALSKITLMITRITKIINGLKLISRNGQNDPHVEFSVVSMLEEIKLLIEMRIRSMDIQFELVVDANINQACGREVQISQVLINLVNNSVDAVLPLKEKWIRIEVNDALDSIEFKVTDSGRGIGDELKDQIMKPFFTTKEIDKGTGLGLSISKSIILEHHGVFYYNDQFPYTQFVFTISKSLPQTIAA